MEQPLVSVIVPVYNVEKYLNQCLDSIVAQTWYNLDVILVDDGSTDNSGAICDEYARSDARIRVVHKKNEGLSAARNTGLDIARGEFIGFVDSDDWIEPNMFEDLYMGFFKSDVSHKNVLFTNGMLYDYDDTTKQEVLARPWPWKRERPQTISSSDLGKAFLSESSNHYVWSKLYRREVFDLVRFREGRNDEDTLFTYELAKAIRKSDWVVVEIDSIIYHYRNRPNSICNDLENPLIHDRIRVLDEICEDCSISWPELAEWVEILKMKTLCWNLQRVYRSRGVDISKWKPYQVMLRNSRWRLSFRAFKQRELVHYLLISFSPFLYRKLYRIREKKNKCHH